MKNYTLILSPKHLLFTLAMLLCSVGAWADNKFYVDDICIESDSYKTINFYLDNDDPIIVMQADIIVPLNFYIDENSATLNAERVNPKKNAVTIVHQGYIRDEKGNPIAESYRFTILPNDINKMVAFSGNSGAIASVRVGCNAGKAADFKLTTIKGSNDVMIDGKPQLIEMPDYTAKIYPQMAKVDVVEKEFAMKKGEPHQVDFALDNNGMRVAGIQFDIEMPEGMSIVTDEDGDPDFIRTDRIPQGYTFSTRMVEENTLRVILSNIREDKFNGYSGTLFSFNLASDELADTSKVIIKNVIISDDASVPNAYKIEGLTLTIVNGAPNEANEAAYARLSEIIAAAEKAVADANDTIAANYPAALEDATVAGIQKIMSDTIAAVKAGIEEQYAAGKLNEESNIDTTGFDEAIAMLLDAAKNAQLAADSLAAAKAANEDAYARLTNELATLQGKLDANQESILAYCPLVAADFIDRIDSLQNELDAAKADVENKYKAVELNAESTVNGAALKTAISDLLKDAIKAQQAAVGIETAKTDANRIVKIYNVTGAEVKHMVKGQVYIVKYANGQTKKVVKK